MSRRYKIVKVSYQVFADFLKGLPDPFKRYESNAPKDMTIERIEYNAKYDCMKVLCQSEEWPEMQQGEAIPVFTLTFIRKDI